VGIRPALPLFYFCIKVSSAGFSRLAPLIVKISKGAGFHAGPGETTEA